MCHDLLEDANLWRQLSELDRQIAAQVQSQGCPCGGVLHRACYPRKPRGAARKLLTEQYESRLSFCCNKEGCRRRTTPPSVRYLGRRVYLGVIVILACAITHGLTSQRRGYLIERLRVDRRAIAQSGSHGVARSARVLSHKPVSRLPPGRLVAPDNAPMAGSCAADNPLCYNKSLVDSRTALSVICERHLWACEGSMLGARLRHTGSLATAPELLFDDPVH